MSADHVNRDLILLHHLSGLATIRLRDQRTTGQEFLLVKQLIPDVEKTIMRSVGRILRGTVCGLAAASLALAVIIGEGTAASAASQTPTKKEDGRGRYLVIIAGCNDCHTAGYADAAGKIPEKDWLTGDRTGWRGPWGTTYAPNLRLYMQQLSEEQWLTIARTVEFRPPMPWYILREMPDQDLTAIYRFIRNLGPAGEQAPTFLPPTQEPPQPYILFPAAP